jgi:hypothetical protein
MFELHYKLIVDDSIRPICPHCEREIGSEVPYFEQTSGPSGMSLGTQTARLFVCPHCHKVLSIGTVD